MIVDRSVLIPTSTWRITSGASSGGVGILVSNELDLEKYLADIIPVNESILVVDFSGKTETTIIVNYAPTEGSEFFEETEEHFEALNNTVNALPKHNTVIEIGDNARLGKNIAH